MKLIYVLLIFYSFLFAEETSTIENKELPTVSEEESRGYISDIIRVDVLYGYQIMMLDVTTDVKSLSKDTNGKSIQLADGGSYNFDAIELEYKKIRFYSGGMSFSYESVDNKLKSSKTSSFNDRLAVKIQKIIGGFTPLKKPNTWLNHTSKWQFITRDAKFSGFYENNAKIYSMQMNKTRYSLKGTIDTEKSSEHVYAYLSLNYEQSQFPMVVYAADGALNFVDKDFLADKLTIVAGTDGIYKNGFILGYSAGFGLSNTTLSAKASRYVSSQGVDLGSSVSYNYQLSAKLGYLNKFKFKYSELELGILYDFEYFKEFSNDVDTSNNNTTLVYDRAEFMGTFKLNARLSF